MEVDEADDKVQWTTFKARLKSREFMASLSKNPSKTMVEMPLKAQKYMNVEDALAAKGQKIRGEKTTTAEEKKENAQIVGLVMGVKERTTELLGR